MPRTLEEFLNENSHRRYPLRDEAPAIDLTGAATLPDSLIVDMRLCAPEGAATAGVFYVSQVVARRLTVDVAISYKPSSGQAFGVGSFVNMGVAAAPNTTYDLIPAQESSLPDVNFADMTGVLTVGLPSAMAGMAGVWSFDSSATPLNPTVVDEGLTQFRSIQLKGRRYYGNVVLREGPGVIITPMYEPSTGTTTLVISASATGRDLALSTNINTPAALVEAIAAYYGPPILKFNNVSPDKDGNIELKGSDCVSVTASDGAITLANPCGKPCCGDDYMQTALEAINQINLKSERILKYYQAMDQLTQQMTDKLIYLEGQGGAY